MIGYDNERGKGDHRHAGNLEVPYNFQGIAVLLDEFWQAVAEKGEVK